MPPHDRLPTSHHHTGAAGESPPFCHVEQEDKSGRSRHYVVHTASPKFVVEFDDDGKTGGEGHQAAHGPPVIRRVCVPNSWAGDYHRCARQLASAMSFFEVARSKKM